MADVAESGSYADAATAISQGKRHLLVQDYTAAVTAFAEGLEMMSQKLSDCDDELGEPYLLYGRALLGLAREEAGVLGGGVPGSEEAEEDEDGEEEDGEEEKLSDVEEKDEESEESEEKKEDTEEKAETDDKTREEGAKKEDKKVEKKEESKEEKEAEKEVDLSTNETEEKKIEEEKSSDATKIEIESVAGSSKGQTNGSASSAEKSCNGVAGKSVEAAEEDEDVNKEDDEEDPGRGIDLQVAWEVLELAKIVFTKRGEGGLKNLAETHRLLGEVAMESDNPQGAITDLESALKLLEKMEPCEPRAIAELHYQLGLAYSLLNDFDASVGQFKQATSLLETRINQLEEMKKDPPKSEDPFYSVEGEIKELKELLPAIQEKITDMKDFKEETCRMVIEGIKNKVAGGCTNGAGSSSDGAGSSSQVTVSPKSVKPASDISHLVRKKRKADEPESPLQSPCKKPTP